MKKFIVGFLIGTLLSAVPAWAGLIPAPPGTVEREVRNYFAHVYHNWLNLPLVTSDPDGSRIGKVGDMALQQNGSSYYLQVNTNSGPGTGTTWVGINLFDLSVGDVTWGNGVDFAWTFNDSSAAADPVISFIGNGITINPNGGDLSVQDDINLRDGTPRLSLVDTTASSDDFNLLVDANASSWVNSTDSVTIWGSNTSNQMTIGSQLVFTPSSAQAITAVGNTILANATTIVLDPDGNYTLTSTPTIADGTQGQLLIITCSDSEANTVTIQDQDSLASSNIQLGAASRTIGALDTLVLRMGTTTWNEVGYADN